MLACFIILAGYFKIPTGIPGSEFQLSAPVAVAIVAVFGFKRYFLAGMIATVLLLLLGIHTIINAEISLIFRLTVGLIILFCGTSIPVLVLAGPIGTAVARIGLAFTLDIPILPLLIPVIPGMIITALCVWPITKMMRTIHEKVGARNDVPRVF
ncbi:hypothetical protein BI350_03170 [Sporosarcina ureilytica]|uniref:Uncharacterized protein n=1 Tax=Sporosarcina ureilytica TaxID=298596 RepID=A0A1D8JK21_9BACL|nr:hypothetical protein BI350_03170 [Sporosarcina ureilytica]